MRCARKLGGKSVDVYPVNYPASLDFATAADGVIDASNKIRDMSQPAARTPRWCLADTPKVRPWSHTPPKTQYLNGFTLPAGITGPMPAEVAKHVAAVALFGKPSSGFLQQIYTGAPPITVGQLYTAKTTDMCIPEDPICSPSGNDNGAHTLYAVNGMAVQAADFAARRVLSNGTATQP